MSQASRDEKQRRRFSRYAQTQEQRTGLTVQELAIKRVACREAGAACRTVAAEDTANPEEGRLHYVTEKRNKHESRLGFGAHIDGSGDPGWLSDLMQAAIEEARKNGDEVVTVRVAGELNGRRRVGVVSSETQEEV